MKFFALFIFALLSASMQAQQKEIPLYNGPAPGSENWTWKEGINNNNSVKVMTVYNVVHPSLTVYAPENGTSNGTAIIIAPGGGFHFLAIDHEGTNAAKWLVKKGITVFILKYRTFHITGDNPFDDMLNAPDPKAWDAEADPVIPLAIADGRAAIRYVRTHAAEFKQIPNQIGFMGFSAGGRVAAGTAFLYDEHTRPDFVAPIYGDIPESLQTKVAQDAPPLFLACTNDDEFGFASHAVNIYNKWIHAQRPVELHLFTKGGHGFGIGNPDNTTYEWLNTFTRWLTTMGFMK